ncbi:cupin domain-containing protein [Methylotenera sp. L2L1]|uniref:cupin domain-containing protein n=1 Tax=Methylotenera sp. L2L1 TaxID=1502770 RepID=UPI0005672F79|nr:cupin domain-containing protein [Methylotenera sp. L2L1]
MNNHNQPLQILGGITATEFLTHYWHKKPLLIKNAIPNFKGLLSPEELAGLACEEEVQSRIVEEIKGKWHATHGPFDEDDFANLPEKSDQKHRWTLLVQSVNHHLPEAAELLSQFNFIPHARLDDLMVSYAPDGGGVGPHFDSYDVFLLQGQGKRLWRISEQTDLSLVEDAPLRILKNFDTAQEWLVEAGDLLYLPPHLAHWGIAVSDDGIDCMTYSIGFRAPKVQELATEFLGFMQDNLNKEDNALPGIYQDADLSLQMHPAEISNSMISKVANILKTIQWSEQHVAAFLGTYLSEPKADVIFNPNKKISLPKFNENLMQYGISLDLKSQMLFTDHYFYLNGESITSSAKWTPLLTALADDRKVTAAEIKQFGEIDKTLIAQLHDWYMAGYLYFNKA